MAVICISPMTSQAILSSPSFYAWRDWGLKTFVTVPDTDYLYPPLLWVCSRHSPRLGWSGTGRPPTLSRSPCSRWGQRGMESLGKLPWVAGLVRGRAGLRSQAIEHRRPLRHLSWLRQQLILTRNDLSFWKTSRSNLGTACISVQGWRKPAHELSITF